MKSFCRRAWAQPIFRLTILALFAGLVAVFNLVTRWPGHHIASAYAVWVQWACIALQWKYIFKQRGERKAFKREIENADFWIEQMKAAILEYQKAEQSFDTPGMSLAEVHFSTAEARLRVEWQRLNKLYNIK